MSAERRLYPRFSLEKQLNVLVKPARVTARSYKVINFSHGGMLLENPLLQGQYAKSRSIELSSDDPIEIQFFDNDDTPPPPAVPATVVRVSGPQLAVQFADPEAADVDRLHALVMRYVSRDEARRQISDMFAQAGVELPTDGSFHD
jgi:hypothetical protein